jgi:hypothetical protein
MVVLSICGFLEKTHFKALESHFKAIAHNSHTPLIEMIYRSGAMFLFNNPLFYQSLIDILENMKKAGTELVLTGKINRKTKSKIEQKITNQKEFAKMTNYFWHDKITNQKDCHDY